MRENYVYYEDRQERMIAVAGFSRPTYNSSTACIAILDGNSFGAEQTSEQVQRCRSFGSPVILVYRDDTLQFWHFSNGQAVRKEQKKTNELDKFFEKYEDKFSPTSISRAKTCGRFDRENQQLSFFDYGLMPIIEKEEGECLSGLIEKIINKLSESANIDQKSDQGAKWLTQAAFWLVGAKILKDKEVKDFKTLDIADIDSLSRRINCHYDAKTPLDITNRTKKKALKYVVSKILEPVSSFSHLSINSLAYVYENTLVTPATRKALGTHSTPSWLVNYIVWQLVDWIEDIPEKDRVILEPACGHAPFLTAGARVLGFLYKGEENNRHEYLKNHLTGIEKDSFAEEIARLALTLTDIPNKDGWQLLDADIYGGDVLKDAAQGANILLCNPPFENFSPNEKQKFHDLKTGNKAAEVLARTLRHMPPKSVFGIILPQGFLHKENLAELRKYILDNCELRTICNLPADNVFAKAGHPSTVLLGRKVKSNKKISYLRIHKSDLETFKDSYYAKEEKIPKDDLYKAKDHSFRVPELKDVWEYCNDYSILGKIATVGRGLEYFGKKSLPEKAVTISSSKLPGFSKGFVSYSKNIKMTGVPSYGYMNLSQEVIRRPLCGTSKDIPQIMLNRIRVSGDNPWRLKAWIDRRGYPCSHNFLVVRPDDKSLLEFFWALLNSPLVNAFVFCHSMREDNKVETIRSIPVPLLDKTSIKKINSLVETYFDLDAGEIFLSPSDKSKEEILLSIDAEIMHLYDLPPKLEKQLLDFFAEHRRKGVDFKFDRYFPKGFDSWIPLHEYLSEEYQRSTPSFVNEWVKKNRSPEVIKALGIAVEAFKED